MPLGWLPSPLHGIPCPATATQGMSTEAGGAFNGRPRAHKKKRRRPAAWPRRASRARPGAWWRAIAASLEGWTVHLCGDSMSRLIGCQRRCGKPQPPTVRSQASLHGQQVAIVMPGVFVPEKPRTATAGRDSGSPGGGRRRPGRWAVRGSSGRSGAPSGAWPGKIPCGAPRASPRNHVSSGTMQPTRPSPGTCRVVGSRRPRVGHRPGKPRRPDRRHRLHHGPDGDVSRAPLLSHPPPCAGPGGSLQYQYAARGRLDHPQAVEPFPSAEAPRFLLHDPDGIYGGFSRRRVRSMGIQEVRIPPHAPWQNPSLERLIRSLRRECLNHMLILGEAHPRRALTASLAYSHEARPPSALARDAPVPRPMARRSGGRDRRHHPARRPAPPLRARRVSLSVPRGASGRPRRSVHSRLPRRGRGGAVCRPGFAF